MVKMTDKSKGADLKLVDGSHNSSDESRCRLTQWVYCGLELPSEADRKSIEHFQSSTTERRRQPVVGVVSKAENFLKFVGPMGQTCEGTSLTRNASKLIQRAIQKNWELDSGKVTKIVADCLATIHDTRESRHLNALQVLVDLDEKSLLSGRKAAA